MSSDSDEKETIQSEVEYTVCASDFRDPAATTEPPANLLEHAEAHIEGNTDQDYCSTVKHENRPPKPMKPSKSILGRPMGGVPLFGANPSMMGEMKSRLRKTEDPIASTGSIDQSIDPSPAMCMPSHMDDHSPGSINSDMDHEDHQPPDPSVIAAISSAPDEMDAVETKANCAKADYCTIPESDFHDTESELDRKHDAHITDLSTETPQSQPSIPSDAQKSMPKSDDAKADVPNQDKCSTVKDEDLPPKSLKPSKSILGRPIGGVPLFGANPNLMGEMKARLRKTGEPAQSVETIDQDMAPSPVIGSPPSSSLATTSSHVNNEEEQTRNPTLHRVRRPTTRPPTMYCKHHASDQEARTSNAVETFFQPLTDWTRET